MRIRTPKTDCICLKCNNKFIGHFISKYCDVCKTKICKNCGNNFINVHSHYCSRNCLIASPVTLKDRLKTGTIMKCVNCDTEFYVANWDNKRKFCSADCRCKYKTTSIKHNKIPCGNLNCTNILFKSDTELNNSDSKIFYCSVKCLNLVRSQKAFEMRKNTGTKPELKFADLLKLHNIDYCVQYWVNWKRGWKKWYDFYLPNIDTLIEVDGTYWHGKNIEDSMLNAQQTKTRKNDKLKNQMAIDQNYKLIRIWEDEIDNFDFETLKGN